MAIHEIALVNWIHPDLLRDVRRDIPDDVQQINEWTYKIHGITFVVTGPHISVLAMYGFLLAHGWTPPDDEEDKSETD